MARAIPRCDALDRADIARLGRDRFALGRMTQAYLARYADLVERARVEGAA
jgi:hypothetical protein